MRLSETLNLLYSLTERIHYFCSHFFVNSTGYEGRGDVDPVPEIPPLHSGFRRFEPLNFMLV